MCVCVCVCVCVKGADGMEEATCTHGYRLDTEEGMLSLGELEKSASTRPGLTEQEAAEES